MPKKNLVKWSYLAQKGLVVGLSALKNGPRLSTSNSKLEQNQMAICTAKRHLWNMWHADYGIRGSSIYLVVVCCFSTGTLQNVPGPTPVSINCASAPWLPEEAVGDFVTPFVLE